MFPTADTLAELVAQLREFLSVEHEEDGTHGAGWTAVPYSNSNFLADGVDGDWDVAQADVVEFKYLDDPNTRTITVVWWVTTTTVASAPGELQIVIPAGKRSAVSFSTPCWLYDNAISTTGLATVERSGRHITIARLDAAALTNATNNTSVSGGITFEYQP